MSGLSGMQTLELVSPEQPAQFVLTGAAMAPVFALAATAALACLASLGRPRSGLSASGVMRGAIWSCVALLGVPAAMAAVAAESLKTAAIALAALTVLDLLPSVRGRRTPLAWLVGGASAALWWWASTLRVEAGAEGSVEWLGTPFSGDTPATLAFLALILPLALPGYLGGVWAGLSSGPVRHRVGILGYGLTATLRPIAYAALFVKTFGGTESLLPLGLILVGLAVLIGLFQRCADERLSTLAYASFWLILGPQGIATTRSEDAFAMGVLGWVIPIVVLALALAFVRLEAAAEPGLAPLGLGRLFPLTYWTSLLAAAAAAGAPFLATFHGRVRAAGALERHGNGQEALGYALASAPLLVLVAMPWIRYVFFQRSVDQSGQGSVGGNQRRLREPIFLLAALFIGSGVTLLIGVAPGLVHALLPHGDIQPAAFPTPLGQLQLLLGAAIGASFFAARVDRSTPQLSSTP